MRNIMIIIALLFAAVSLEAQTSTWEAMNRGLGHTLIYNIAIDPVDSLRMFCGTDAGQVYESVDGGFNWSLRSEGLPPSTTGWRVIGLFLDPSDRNLLYAGISDGPAGKRLFKSTDGGASWTFLPTPDNWSVFNIMRVPLTPPRLVCALGSYQGLYWSDDDGLQWTAGLKLSGVQVAAMHPSRPSLMLAGTVGGSNASLRRSTDGGSTWQAHSMDFVGGAGVGVRAISFAPQSPDVVYIGVTHELNEGKEGLYRSVDAGVTWQKLKAVAEISEIAVHPRNENLIYISAIHSGVHRSTDGGQSWIKIGEGLPTTDVMRVRIAPGYPVCVFAVTLKHGAFRMVDEELKEDLFVR